MNEEDRARFIINFCNGDRNVALNELFTMVRAYTNTKHDKPGEYWAKVAKIIMGIS